MKYNFEDYVDHGPPVVTTREQASVHQPSWSPQSVSNFVVITPTDLMNTHCQENVVIAQLCAGWGTLAIIGAVDHPLGLRVLPRCTYCICDRDIGEDPGNDLHVLTGGTTGMITTTTHLEFVFLMTFFCNFSIQSFKGCLKP